MPVAKTPRLHHSLLPPSIIPYYTTAVHFSRRLIQKSPRFRHSCCPPPSIPNTPSVRNTTKTPRLHLLLLPPSIIFLLPRQVRIETKTRTLKTSRKPWQRHDERGARTETQERSAECRRFTQLGNCLNCILMCVTKKSFSAFLILLSWGSFRPYDTNITLCVINYLTSQLTPTSPLPYFPTLQNHAMIHHLCNSMWTKYFWTIAFSHPHTPTRRLTP